MSNISILSYNCISKLVWINIMELLHRQAAIAKLRGEPDLSDVLRDIFLDEKARLEKIESAKRKAENVVLHDEDR